MRISAPACRLSPGDKLGSGNSAPGARPELAREPNNDRKALSIATITESSDTIRTHRVVDHGRSQGQAAHANARTTAPDKQTRFVMLAVWHRHLPAMPQNTLSLVHRTHRGRTRRAEVVREQLNMMVVARAGNLYPLIAARFRPSPVRAPKRIEPPLARRAPHPFVADILGTRRTHNL